MLFTFSKPFLALLFTGSPRPPAVSFHPPELRQSHTAADNYLLLYSPCFRIQFTKSLNPSVLAAQTPAAPAVAPRTCLQILGDLKSLETCPPTETPKPCLRYYASASIPAPVAPCCCPFSAKTMPPHLKPFRHCSTRQPPQQTNRLTFEPTPKTFLKTLPQTPAVTAAQAPAPPAAAPAPRSCPDGPASGPARTRPPPQRRSRCRACTARRPGYWHPLWSRPVRSGSEGPPTWLG